MEQNNVISNLKDCFLQIVVLMEPVACDVFFHKDNDETWSIAEELHHLSLTYMPANKTMEHSEYLLKLYGPSGRHSRSEEQFKLDYELSVGVNVWKAFPQFVPALENKSAEYQRLHASQDQEKLKTFYNYTGPQLLDLPKTSIIYLSTAKEDIIKTFEDQSTFLLKNCEQLNDEELSRYQLPVPYVGLITLKEFLYFTLSHTRYHMKRIIEKTL